MPTWELICLDDRALPARLELDAPVECGRDPHCDVRLLVTGASRFHARLTPHENGPWLKDLGSRNGTLLAGKPISQQQLADGDCFHLAGVPFVVACRQTGGSRVHLDEGLSLQALTPAIASAPADRFAPLLRRLAPLDQTRRRQLLTATAKGLVQADAAALVAGGDRLAGDMPATLAARLVAGPQAALLQLGTGLQGATIARAAIGSALSVPMNQQVLVCSRGVEREPFDQAQLQLLTGLAETCTELLAESGTADDGLIGSSQAMQILRRRFQRLARSQATLLITGPSGSGKELVAQAVHRASARAAGPFVTVNCAAIAESLFEAECFGAKRGAYTGADQDRPGRFQQADGGTLFLDEVGELPLAQQAKLLRALQEGQVQAVGGNPEAVNVRVLAATNRDLDAAVADGLFREDLLYRLDVLRIHVPALQERRDDIPALAKHLIDRFAHEDGFEPLPLSDAALAALRNRAWPGQVRQLGNVLRRALALVKGNVITARDLDSETIADASDDSGFPTLAGMEAKHIAAAMAATEQNKSAAARLLGISRPTLYKKLIDYGLESGQTPPDSAS